ncbi:hypothetical protein HanRHA438_Chr09g0405841 [Helianthus annuus]|nr:hypothetical protein HanRHA438_Chr09g0405841 [Helianthus annuus]
MHVCINSSWFTFRRKFCQVKYNTFSRTFLCTFSVGLRFDVNAVWKRVGQI